MTKKLVRELIIKTPFDLPTTLKLYLEEDEAIIYTLTVLDPVTDISHSVSLLWPRRDDRITDEIALGMLGQKLLSQWAKMLKILKEPQ
jgi:hypothetical protein